MEATQQEFLQAVPATGERLYDEIYHELRGAGKGGVLKEFHNMRRSGALTVRREIVGNAVKLFVSRPTTEQGG